MADGAARGAIFDLDGTLADTAADLLTGANAALAEWDMPTLDLERDRPHAGRGGRSMILRSVSLMERPPEDVEARVQAVYPRLLEAYGARIAEQTVLFDGVEACLDRLESTGWRLGVCTNKPEGLARRLLDALGIASRFAAILGADTLPVRKPDPEHLLATCRGCGADPGASVLIGDTKTDADTGANAGVPVVLTRFGFAEQPIEALRAAAVIDHYDALPELLERLRPVAKSA